MFPIYVRTYICMHLNMCICTYVRTFVHTYPYVRTCIYTLLYPGAWAFSIYLKDTAVCIYTVYTGVYERIPQDVPNYLIVSSHCH